MSLYSWYNKTLTKERDEWVTDESGNKLYTERIEDGSFSGNLQQATEEQAESMNLKFGKVYNFYTDIGSDIKEGDILKDGDDSYSVRGLKDFKSPKTENDHLKVILEK